MKSTTLPWLSVLAALVILTHGCKKDDTTPAAPAPQASSFSFNTEDGNFAANGTYNPYATSGSGAGWYSSNVIAAYSIVSATNLSVVTMMFMPAPSVGTFNFPGQGGMSWMLNANPNDSASMHAKMCATRSGSVVVSAHGGGTSQGTFSGRGIYVYNQTDTCTITGGAFTIYSSTAKRPLPPEVERVVRRMMEHVNQ